MKIAWVLHQDIQRNTIDKDLLKKVGPTWGSYHTFALYNTDNVIAYHLKSIKDITKKNIQRKSNLYIPVHNFIPAGAPDEVYQFGGSFNDPNTLNAETIVALNLSAVQSDVILLVGFDISPIFSGIDQLHKHRILTYYHNIQSVIKDNATCQFVLVDYRLQLHELFNNLDNLSIDTSKSVEEQLIS